MSVNCPEFNSQPVSEVSAHWLIVGLFESDDDQPEFQALDQVLNGALRILRSRNDLKCKFGDTVLLPVPTGIAAERLLIVGLGDAKKLTAQRWEQAVLTGFRRASSVKDNVVCWAIPTGVAERLGTEQTTQIAAFASEVATAGQGLYKKEAERFPFSKVILNAPEGTLSADAAKTGVILAESVNLVRELVNRHPEDLVPITFAQLAVEEAHAVGVKTEVFDHARLLKERMGSLLAVARGSEHEPRIVVFRYEGAGKGAPTLALCGKGVTFDSGGLSIKPSDSMITMKCDMAGAATVLGTITALAKLKVPVNVLGVVGLVENMISGRSYKLGEVLTARNGTTIEVHNTDAEGRLVLADVLSYTVDQKPAKLIDLATLTGACVVALGMDITGAFTNDQAWCDELLASSREVGEEVWQLPMHDFFNDQLKCDFADVKNVGTRWGGATTAAKFLEKFVNEIPWVHLDIAGPAFAESGKPYRDVGGTGVMVRTLVALAEKFAKESA